MTLSLLVLARNAAGIAQFLRANGPSFREVDELRLVISTDARFGGQAHLSNILKRSALGKVCGVVHADTIFEPGDFQIFIRTALDGKVCGLVGASNGPAGRTPTQKNVWGLHVKQETPVSTVDCCSAFFRSDIPVEFDGERFRTWHCVNEDFCLSAAEAGYPVVVPATRAFHHGESTFQPEWQAEYRKYRQILDEKWAGTVFETT